MKRLSLLVAALVLLTTVAAWSQEAVNVPLTGLQPALSNGYQAEVKTLGPAAARLTFTKSSEERRLLAVAVKPQADATGARALALQYKLDLKSGAAPLLAVVVFDKAGGSWYRLGEALVPGAETSGRISVQGLRPTSFSPSEAQELDFSQIASVWVGFVAEGAVAGTCELSAPRLTSEPYRPTHPVVITSGASPGTWSVSQDTAVKSTLTTPQEGPEGQACLKYEFTVPTGRHMFCIPSVATPVAEYDSYSGLRFTYKAVIPTGMGGLLVCLSERSGAQYYAEPAPPPSGEWTTVTIPFDKFKLATWTQDNNTQLDLADIVRVHIGCHGGASTTYGLILVSDVQIVP